VCTAAQPTNHNSTANMKPCHHQLGLYIRHCQTPTCSVDIVTTTDVTLALLVLEPWFTCTLCYCHLLNIERFFCHSDLIYSQQNLAFGIPASDA
jgi:hypothetical protein